MFIYEKNSAHKDRYLVNSNRGKIVTGEICPNCNWCFHYKYNLDTNYSPENAIPRLRITRRYPFGNISVTKGTWI